MEKTRLAKIRRVLDVKLTSATRGYHYRNFEYLQVIHPPLNESKHNSELNVEFEYICTYADLKNVSS